MGQHNHIRFSPRGCKKRLHKVKKQWVVLSVSVSLLSSMTMLSNRTAHADTSPTHSESISVNSQPNLSTNLDSTSNRLTSHSDDTSTASSTTHSSSNVIDAKSSHSDDTSTASSTTNSSQNVTDSKSSTSNVTSTASSTTNSSSNVIDAKSSTIDDTSTASSTTHSSSNVTGPKSSTSDDTSTASLTTHSSSNVTGPKTSTSDDTSTASSTTHSSSNVTDAKSSTSDDTSTASSTTHSSSNVTDPKSSNSGISSSFLRDAADSAVYDKDGIKKFADGHIEISPELVAKGYNPLASASISGKTVTLVPDRIMTIGTAQYNSAIDLTKPFSITLDINWGGDGMGMLFYPASQGKGVTGFSGGGVGIVGVPNAYGFKIDLFANPDDKIEPNVQMDSSTQPYAVFEDTDNKGYEKEVNGNAYNEFDDKGGNGYYLSPSTSGPVSGDKGTVTFSYVPHTNTAGSQQSGVLSVDFPSGNGPSISHDITYNTFDPSYYFSITAGNGRHSTVQTATFYPQSYTPTQQATINFVDADNNNSKIVSVPLTGHLGQPVNADDSINTIINALQQRGLYVSNDQFSSALNTAATAVDSNGNITNTSNVNLDGSTVYNDGKVHYSTDLSTINPTYTITFKHQLKVIPVTENRTFTYSSVNTQQQSLAPDASINTKRHALGVYDLATNQLIGYSLDGTTNKIVSPKNNTTWINDLGGVDGWPTQAQLLNTPKFDADAHGYSYDNNQFNTAPKMSNYDPSSTGSFNDTVANDNGTTFTPDFSTLNTYRNLVSNYPTTIEYQQNSHAINTYSHGMIKADVDHPGTIGQPVEDNSLTNWPTGTDINSLQKIVHRTIHFVDSNGNAIDTPLVQSVTFTRTATVDKVTGQLINYSAWQTPSDDQFGAYSAPDLSSHQYINPNVSEIEAVTPTVDSADLNTTIVYQIATHTIPQTHTVTRTINYVDADNNQSIAPSTVQSVTFSRTAIVQNTDDKIIGYITPNGTKFDLDQANSAWTVDSTNQLAAINIADLSVHGYNHPSTSIVPAMTILPTTSNLTVTIKYQSDSIKSNSVPIANKPTSQATFPTSVAPIAMHSNIASSNYMNDSMLANSMANNGSLLSNPTFQSTAYNAPTSQAIGSIDSVSAQSNVSTASVINNSNDNNSVSTNGSTSASNVAISNVPNVFVSSHAHPAQHTHDATLHQLAMHNHRLRMRHQLHNPQFRPSQHMLNNHVSTPKHSRLPQTGSVNSKYNMMALVSFGLASIVYGLYRKPRRHH